MMYNYLNFEIKKKLLDHWQCLKVRGKIAPKNIETFPPNIAQNQPTPEIQHSTRTSVLFDTAGRTVRAVFDTDKNLTFYMDGFTRDSAVGAKLYLGYEGANLYKNVTVDFVGNSTGKHMVGLLVSFYRALLFAYQILYRSIEHNNIGGRGTF